MEEDNQSLEVDILAASLRLDGKQSQEALELLAKKLLLALPDNVTVTRGGWLLGEKPVKEILVRFEDFHYQLVKEKQGPVISRQLKIVRGVALKTTDISYDEWTKLVAQEMAALAAANASARDALDKMVR